MMSLMSQNLSPTGVVISILKVKSLNGAGWDMHLHLLDFVATFPCLTS